LNINATLPVVWQRALLMHPYRRAGLSFR
jgi:hypothetical protein